MLKSALKRQSEALKHIKSWFFLLNNIYCHFATLFNASVKKRNTPKEGAVKGSSLPKRGCTITL